MNKSFKTRPLSKRISLLSLGLITSALLTSGSANAQIDADIAAELRAQIAALSSRLELLENDNAEMSATLEETQVTIQSTAQASSSNSSSWANRIKISGDLRPRYEVIDDASKPEARNRSRVRARLAIAAQITDHWGATFGLASGSDDPISTNQTFGSGSSTKGLGLDYAYFSYTGFDNTTITGGKYKNIFFKPGGQNLIFDGDLRPEGLALKYINNDLFVNVASMLIQSDDKAGSQDTATMWGVQLGYDFGAWTLGGSYYTADVAGSKPFYNGKAYSNSLDASGAYLYDYDEFELFAEANFIVSGQKLRLFADYVSNLDADEFDTGWVLGAKLGSASNAGNWEAGYIYQDIEADAVFGTFTDSDFANSGTDGKGHMINAGYGLSDSTKLTLTYFINEYGENAGLATDYNRLHLALQLKF